MEQRDSALEPDAVKYYLRLDPESDLPYEPQPTSNRANLSEFQLFGTSFCAVFGIVTSLGVRDNRTRIVLGTATRRKISRAGR